MLHKDTLESLKEQVGAIAPGEKLSVNVPSSISTADYASLLSGVGLMLLNGTADGRTLYGTKPYRLLSRVSALMSMPRLTFTANMQAVHSALPPLNISFKTVSGPYWGQGIERGIEACIHDGAEAVLTIDYDTVFTARDVSILIQLMCCYPEVDAVSAIQCHRGSGLPMFTFDRQNEVSTPDLIRVTAAHFGLTLLRSECFTKIAKPWFHDVPAPDGSWNESHRDADINFWDKWTGAGNSIYVGTRVPVGHLELMIVWPGRDHLKGVYQTTDDYRANGIPKDAWS